MTSVHVRSVTTNIKFAYKDQKKKLHRLLKYFQYRNDKSSAEHVRQWDEFGQRIERWHDCGLGTQHHEILENVLDLATDSLKRDVGARLLVIGPEVSLMQAIDPDKRVNVLRELTEKTLDNWFERMDLPTPEFSYVVHESQPSETRPDGRLKDEMQTQSYLHTHVVLAPTVTGLERERELYKVYDKQVRWLHEAGRDAIQEIWEREIGVEQFAELQVELSERDLRQKELDRQHEQTELEKVFVAEPSRVQEATPPVSRAMDEGLEMEWGE
jgi:hypothetical protein